jgi:hypothetical protein
MDMLNRSHMRKWQVSAAAMAAAASLLLAAQPGAGKTIVILTALSDALASGRIHRALLIAPRAILDSVFEAEARRWEHTHHLQFDFAHRHTGTERNHLWFKGTGHIVTCTPDTVPALAAEVMRRGIIPFESITADEGQLFKAPGSTRTKALHALAGAVDHFIFSSGTPTPNGSVDGWSPGRLVAKDNPFWSENFHAWRGRHFNKASTFTWRPKPGTDQRVRDELAKCGISIRLDQASDIPAAVYGVHPFEFDAKHRQRIVDFMRDGEIEVGGEPFGSDSEEARLTLLHELTCGFIYRDGVAAELSMGRVEALRDLVETVQGPVLVGVKFKADAEMIRRAFPKAVVYAGSTPAADRARIIEDWNADRIQMLLGSPSSMGLGLNLQLGSAQTVVWYSMPWSWELFAQFNARLIRSGQRKTVSVMRLESTVGIDKAVAAVIERKQSGEKALLAALNIVKGTAA